MIVTVPVGKVGNVNFPWSMAYKFSADARVNTLHYNQSYKDYSDHNEGIFKENLQFQNEVTSELS
jgi:hypothetical protein